MPRRQLSQSSGLVFHVLNRSAGRVRIFFHDSDDAAFQKVLSETLERIPTRLLGYCVMPNHWHLVLWPSADELPRFMHWLTLTHAKRLRRANGSEGTGPVYQNRYKAVPVQNDHHLLTLLRYVERNPVRSHLVPSADGWRWSSMWQRQHGSPDLPLADLPIAIPANWLDIVNQAHTRSELLEIQQSIKTGQPLGDKKWAADVAKRLALTVGKSGRPPKRKPGLVFS